MAFQNPLWLGNYQYTPTLDRFFVNAKSLIEGVGSSTDLVVSEKSVPDASVDVSAGYALVEGDEVSRQGLYGAYNDAVVNKAASTGSPVTHPRVDIVVARLKDSSYLGAGGDRDVMFIDIITGTETSGANATNRSGAPALPATAIWLADIVWTTSDSVIVNAMIYDRRTILGPRIDGEDGLVYRLGVDSSGLLGMEAV